MKWHEGKKRVDGAGRKHWRKETMGFSLNAAELSLNSVNSGNLKNHWSMNWDQFNCLLCLLCLNGRVVESLSLTQEIVGSSTAIFLKWYYFCYWIQRKLRENSNTNSIMLSSSQDKRMEKIFKLQEMCCQCQLGSCIVCGYPTHSLHWFSCEHIFLFFTFYR